MFLFFSCTKTNTVRTNNKMPRVLVAVIDHSWLGIICCSGESVKPLKGGVFFEIGRFASCKITSLYKSKDYLIFCIFTSPQFILVWNIFYIWTGAPSCDSNLLDQVQKQISNMIGPSLVSTLQPLLH